MAVNVRRFFDPAGTLLPEEDLAALTPFAEEEEQQIEGPTEELPFRFTEQALNPRARAVRGVSQRDPRARSAATIGGIGGPSDPLELLGQQLGLSPEEQEAARNPAFVGGQQSAFLSGTTLEQQQFLPGVTRGLGVGQRLEDETVAREQRRENINRIREAQDRLAAVRRGDPGATITEEDRLLAETGPHAQFTTEDLSGEQQIFRTLSNLTPEQREGLDLTDPELISGLSRVGGRLEFPGTFEGLSPRATTRRLRDVGRIGGSGFGTVAGGIIRGLIGAGAAFINPAFGAAFASGQTAAQGGNLAQIGLSAVPSLAGGLIPGGGGFGRLGTTSIGAVRAGAAAGLDVSTGAAVNAATRQLAQQRIAQTGFGALQQQTTQRLADIVAPRSLQAVAGGPQQTLNLLQPATSGALSNIFDIGSGNRGANLLGRARSIAQSPAGRIGRAGISSGIEARETLEARNLAQQQAQTSAQSRGLGIAPQSVFSQRLPDNPFYDPVEDLVSGQAEVL